LGETTILKNAICIDDLRTRHRRNVPRAFFDYIDGGAYTEQTLRANCEDLQKLPFRQRVLVDVDNRDLSTTIMGEKSALPFGLGPIGLSGTQYGDGEIHACRAAQKAGIPYTLSTMSICSIEDVASSVDKPFWFQLYVMRDRGFTRELVERAIAAKCSTLMLTVDLTLNATRFRDVRNGITVPPKIMLRNVIDCAMRPGWSFGVLNGKRKTFGNLAGKLKGSDNLGSLAQWIAAQFDPALTWKDVDWIRSIWPGKLLIKGILDADDARNAAKSGAQALVVSNHGGRQLDGAPSTISVLPQIVDAVGHDIDVMFDGGIRSGQDVVRAMALGAKSCLLGRAYAYGLGAGGEAGVARAIDIIRGGLDLTMGMCGHRTPAEINRNTLM
jgi:L-lactate dehydrogenase (cytochrome)